MAQRRAARSPSPPTPCPPRAWRRCRTRRACACSRYLDAPPVDELPASLLQLAPDQVHALVIDTSRSRLYVYANDLGRPRYVTDFYISLGRYGVDKEREGDQKTPIGVYTHRWATKEKLPDILRPARLPALLSQRLGPHARPQGPRHLAARHARGNLQPPAVGHRRLRRAHQRRPRAPLEVRGREPHAGGDRPIHPVARPRALGSRPPGLPRRLRRSGRRTGKASTRSATCRTTRCASTPTGRTSRRGRRRRTA